MRIPLVVLALASVVATMWAFARETLPRGAARVAAADGHLSKADLRALAAPISYVDAVPVINYHDVSLSQGPYSVAPQQFATQLAALRRAGFQTVSLDQVRELASGGHPTLPLRPLLITFDDGIASEYSYADPILARYHFTAVSFLITGRIVSGAKPSYYLSWPQVQRMRATGRWDFQSHTNDGHHDVATAPGKTGPWLTNLTAGPNGRRETVAAWRRRVDADLARSVNRLRRLTGRVPYAFAFPFAAAALPTNDPVLVEDIPKVIARHFAIAFSSDLQVPVAVDRHSDPMLLPRYEVTSSVDVSTLFAALRRMVPSAPSSDVASWNLTGDACHLTGGTVTLVSPGYGICPGGINGGQWTDYRLSMSARGLTGKTTLIVMCQSNAAGDVEVSVGSRRTVLRQLTGSTYATLASWRSPPPGPDGTHALSAEVHDGAITVTVDGVALGTEHLPDALTYGGPGLGIAGGGTIVVSAIDVTDLRARASGP